MKRTIAIGLVLLLLVSCTTGFAKSKRMDQDFPQWTEETVRTYLQDYIDGTSMDRLWSYYDLQIRRYMPMETYRALLLDMKWMTGEFVSFGAYRCYDEPQTGLRVHVQHLCMEKQDLDVYFSHKNEEDDWEVMALEFVPAAKENASALPQSKYTELAVTTGTQQYPLQATITMPLAASESNPVMGCVLVHDDGAFDRDMTLGQTKLFADFADMFGKNGIATIRYEKRAYVYPDAALTNLDDEVITDAVAAVHTLAGTMGIDASRIVLIGVGFGAELCPRIARDAEGAVCGMVMIGANGVPKLQQILQAEGKEMTRDEQNALKNLSRNIARMEDEDLIGISYRGRDGFFYRDLVQNDQMKILDKLSLPTYIIQGRNDPIVSEDDGRKAYSKELGISSRFADYGAYRGLNHLLMNDLTTDENGQPQYRVEAHLDEVAAQDIRSWLAKTFPAGVEEE